MNSDFEYIEIDLDQGLDAAFKKAKELIESGSNIPVALHIKRSDAIYLNEIHVPNYSEQYLAGIKNVIRLFAKDNKKFQAVIDNNPHIFDGDNNCGSPELEETIIIPVRADTSFNDVRAAIHDDLEICDTIALVQLHDGHYSDEIPKIINLLHEDLFDKALLRIKDVRKDKQQLVKFSPDNTDWKDTDKISNWLNQGIDISYQYTRRNALFLQLPEEQTPNYHGFSCPFLWIEDQAGNRIRPEHLFLVMHPDGSGDEVLNLREFVVKGFDLGVPISFTTFEFQERLEHSMRDHFGIEIDDDFNEWEEIEKFKGAKKDIDVFSPSDIQDAHKMMIMVYLYGQKRGINVLDPLEDLNKFIASKMPIKVEVPSNPAKPLPFLTPRHQ